MKTITPFNNTPTIVHVKELPELTDLTLAFGFNPGWLGNPPETPTLRINVDLVKTNKNGSQLKIATYNSFYKIEGEGLILEDHLYSCCQQAVHGLKIFLRFDKVGRSIPPDSIQLVGKEAFEDDLVVLAKFLNASEGKRGFPFPK